MPGNIVGTEREQGDHSPPPQVHSGGEFVRQQEFVPWSACQRKAQPIYQ